MGMPEGMTDPNQILAWVVGKMGSEAVEPIESMEAADDVIPPQGEPLIESMDTPDEEKPVENMDTPEEKIENAVSRALKADAARRKEIRALCEAHKIERAYADSLCDDGATLTVARERILKRMATNPIGQTTESVRITASEDDKVYAAARDGLLLRSQQSAGIKRSLTGDAKPAPDGWSDKKIEAFAAKFGLEAMARAALGHAGDEQVG
jgi:hypothetical protein